MYRVEGILKKLPEKIQKKIDRHGRNLKHMLVLYSATSRQGFKDIYPSFSRPTLENECENLPIKVYRENAGKYYGELAQEGYVEIVNKVKKGKKIKEFRLTLKGKDEVEKAILDLNMNHWGDAFSRFNDIAEIQEEKAVFIDLKDLLWDAGIRPSKELLDIFQIEEGKRDLPFLMVGDYVSLWEPREFKPWEENDIVFDIVEDIRKIEKKDFKQLIREIKTPDFKQLKDERVEETVLRVTQAYPNLKPNIHKWIEAYGKLSSDEKDLPKFFIKDIIDQSHDEGGKLHIKLDISRYLINKALEKAYQEGNFKETYKNRTLYFDKDMPNMVVVGLALYTKDCNTILGLRSHHVAHHPKTWSGMCEQMNPVADRDFFDTCIRGLYEEFGINVDRECIKLLTIGREGINGNVNVFGVADLQNFEASEIIYQWRGWAPDGYRKEFDYLDFRPLESLDDLRSMLKILRNEKYVPRSSGRPIENFHPTAKMMLLLLLLYRFGEEAVKDTLLNILESS